LAKEKKKGKKRREALEAAHQAEEVLVIALDEAAAEGSENGAVAEDLEAGLPAIFSPSLEGDYSAAFAEELTDPAFLQQAFLAQLPLSALFVHHGRVSLSADGLEFEGLAQIPFSALLAVQAHTDRVYHRYYAGLAALGGRGGHSHILTGGEPLVLTYQDGDARRTLYTLLDWPFFLALSKEKGWRKAVGGILPAKEKKGH
jgi:hypothetical protein